MPKIRVGFEKMADAVKAVRELKNMGYNNAHVDMADNYVNEYSEEINPLGAANAPSLSALVLRSNGHLDDIDKAPLIASDPMVSGMGSYNEIAENISASVIVNTDEERKDEVYQTLRRFGGNTK